MKLYSLLDEDHVLIGEEVASFDAALERLLGLFAPTMSGTMLRSAGDRMTVRERRHPTHLIEGVYVPHLRIEGLDRFAFGLLIPAHPVPHFVEGQAPVTMMFLILAPQNKNTMMLQALAAVARLIKSKSTRKTLLNVRSAGRLIRVVEESGVDVKQRLVAGDIMSPIQHIATLETILTRAVDMLVAAPDEGIPVLNEQGRLAGELTSLELMKLGMPKYLDLIAEPEILDRFEPFENFFRYENSLTVREVCRRDVIAVEPATAVVQVAHLMMTHRQRRAYVVEDHELKGVIYRKNIVSRVLHY